MPWPTIRPLRFRELIEHICEENSKAPEEAHGKPPE
jgi:hypothetical protein